ncbi:M15 family metallopeptidase [Leptolyngbya sp. FACHB-261]|uniref:M15 family metallopeptidase n=1 Tax=Leptolyngbya sp. FACHB-261 TaxID=2692806 RepID=UPI0016824192|nr:M15 family metallopeptidase [Leptolyngbya sp. FACHB-261]MBD2103465.1 M15 family metallopeptidase [Leptolyngbya sp. FACHB-261]
MKPYQTIPIQECGEALVPISESFAFQDPHPYVRAGAPYKHKSPFWVRSGVLVKLQEAQAQLHELVPGWRLKIFDAYRPVAVQQYMVDYTFIQQAKAQGLNPASLIAAQQQELYAQVYTFWAVPNENPATPPPHSTGAAVDVTLVDAGGQEVDMGSPIDEMSPRSYPDHFQDASESKAQQFHAHRQLLHRVMTSSGFQRHTLEWWHFSFGDQFWAWRLQTTAQITAIACYGRA